MKFFLALSISLFFFACTNAPTEKPQIDETSKKLGRAKLPIDPNFKKYAEATKNRLRILPRKTERQFAQNYVDYMVTGDPQQGQKLIQLLKKTVTEKQEKLSSEWISIFGGGEKLIEKRINLGVMTSTRLMKLISFGDPTSIEFLLIYSASVELNEVDAVRIQNYSAVVKTSYKEILKASILKNEAFLLDFPQAI